MACASASTNTQKKLGDLFVHEGTVEQGALRSVCRSNSTSIMRAARAIRANHSATHLLHEALRQVLGDHVAQKGSLVAPDRLRFDFAHPKPISPGELAEVEDIANRVVLQNAPVETRLMDVDAAIESGARALFGEKYGEQVRVVSMGDARRRRRRARQCAFSVELCGGTHVRRTGDIGLISIVSEIARRGGRAAHRSEDGPCRAPASQCAGASFPGARASAQGAGGRGGGASRPCARGAAQARSRIERGAQDVWRWAAARAQAAVEEIGGVKFFRKEVAASK